MKIIGAIGSDSYIVTASKAELRAIIGNDYYTTENPKLEEYISRDEYGKILIGKDIPVTEIFSNIKELHAIPEGLQKLRMEFNAMEKKLENAEKAVSNTPFETLKVVKKPKP